MAMNAPTPDPIGRLAAIRVGGPPNATASPMASMARRRRPRKQQRSSGGYQKLPSAPGSTVVIG